MDDEEDKLNQLIQMDMMSQPIVPTAAWGSFNPPIPQPTLTLTLPSIPEVPHGNG